MFLPVDMGSYPRKEQYEYFRSSGLCYSLTVELDLAELPLLLKQRSMRSYPAQIWIIANAVNSVPEMRMAEQDGQLGYWDISHPLYAVPGETDAISLISTEYSVSFPEFYEQYIIDTNQPKTGFLGKGSDLPNTFNISSLPWLDFSSVSFSGMPSGGYRPQFVIGKYREGGFKTLMPLSITVHHAVCDGSHLARTVEKIKELIAAAEEWIK